MSFQSGDILLGKYRIDRFIAAGKFAEVYQATHLKLNAVYALKVLRRDGPGLGSSDYGRWVERFRQEATLGAGLKSPYIVTVYDYEEQDDLLVLRMDYLPGGSLADRLQKLKTEGRQMPVIDAVRVALDVAQGLAVLHGAEVVHRDVKPSNILFAADGRALVADLGLAQAPGGSSDRLVLSGEDRPWQPGTRDYMSPEQVHSKDRLTSASDIYTLGAVIFEMLTGRLYRNVKPGTKVQALRPDTPKWLVALLGRMLAEDYRARPWNGSEVAEALQAGLAADQKRLEREVIKQTERERKKAAEEAARQSAALEVARREEAHRAEAIWQGEKERQQAVSGVVVLRAALRRIVIPLTLRFGWRSPREPASPQAASQTAAVSSKSVQGAESPTTTWAMWRLWLLRAALVGGVAAVLMLAIDTSLPILLGQTGFTPSDVAPLAITGVVFALIAAICASILLDKGGWILLELGLVAALVATAFPLYWTTDGFHATHLFLVSLYLVVNYAFVFSAPVFIVYSALSLVLVFFGWVPKRSALVSLPVSTTLSLVVIFWLLQG